MIAPDVVLNLNTILFRAAWGALLQVLGIDERELAAIFTIQTAGEALNHHPHLHGLLADRYWKDDVFTRFSEVDLKAIEDAFAERVLAQLHKQELISDDDVAQILSQDHTGFGVPVPRSLVRRGMARGPLEPLTRRWRLTMSTLAYSLSGGFWWP